MKAITTEGQEIEIRKESIDGFRMRLKGPVLLPGDPGYEESRTVWNSMIDRRPAMVVRCLGNADVIECIKFSNEHRLSLCIKGGGHNIAGLGTADGAIMLDMSLMRGVWVYPKRKTVHAQAGCLVGDVDRETQIHGLATVLGFVSLTGITGLTLGGGIGYLTRRWGWTSDNVTAFNMVTADARLVRATSEENKELFWALQGGGGNFGVVTGIDYNLYPVGPEIYGGFIAWHASEASRILDLYRSFSAEAPHELTLVAILRPAPPAPWLPQDVHGKPVIMLLACYSGKPEDGEKILAPLKTYGTPVGNALVRQPYVQLQSAIDQGQPKGRRYYWKSEYLPRIEPELCEKVVSNTINFPSPFSALVLFQIGGALNYIDEDYSPVGNRNAQYVLNIMNSWEHSTHDRLNIDWVQGLWNGLKSFSTGGNYINFQTEDEDYGRIRAAYGDKIEKLSEIKAKWDPENKFRINRNIKPAVTARQVGKK